MGVRPHPLPLSVWERGDQPFDLSLSTSWGEGLGEQVATLAVEDWQREPVRAAELHHCTAEELGH